MVMNWEVDIILARHEVKEQALTPNILKHENEDKQSWSLPFWPHEEEE